MTGKATIYFNGEIVHEKKATVSRDVVIPLKKGLETIEINVFLQPDNKSRALLADIVYVSPEKVTAKASTTISSREKGTADESQERPALMVG